MEQWLERLLTKLVLVSVLLSVGDLVSQEQILIIIFNGSRHLGDF